MKRLSSNLRSPLFQHFNESINGLTTVRAFDALAAFTAKSGQTVDDWSRAQMCQQSSPRWLGMRISSLSSVSIFITSFGWPEAGQSRDDVLRLELHAAAKSQGGQDSSFKKGKR